MKDLPKSLGANVPPSFGGPCRFCFGSIAGTIYHMSSCHCMSIKPSRGHYDSGELHDFLAKIVQYDLGRRLFGTDHSIGLGPRELENWDEVWILDGSRVPFILRRMGIRYKVVGACYMHAAIRTSDNCSTCSKITIRKEYTLIPEDISSGVGRLIHLSQVAQFEPRGTSRKVFECASEEPERGRGSLPGQFQQIEIISRCFDYSLNYRCQRGWRQSNF